MNTHTRTDFPTAVTKTLEILKKGETFTQNKLAQKTDLNSRTVNKILLLLGEVQSILKEKEIDISSSENVKIIRMKDRGGLASLPDSLQKLIVKTVYYPTASREEEILTHLLLRKAIDKNSAISIPKDKVLKGLIEAEHVSEIKGEKFYLTSDGVIIASGALKLYPELKEIRGPLEIEFDNALRDYVATTER